jgi:hypothetical protein
MLDVAAEATPETKAALREGGLVIGQSRAEPEYCQRVRAFIDEFPVDDAEVNYAGSEVRIWRAHEKNADIADFRRFADALLSRMFGKKIESRDILAIRNLPVDDGPNLVNGRWHLDSLFSQIKVFLFLSDVSERSGPLELVRGTHKPAFKFRHLAAGRLMRPSDLVGTARRYQKLDDAWVDSLTAERGVEPVICEEGSIAIVNTGAIHRARPCLEGGRYALTAYYDHL